MDVKEIEAKSILVKSGLPDADYVVNPYTGCQFGCTYCYAAFMAKYVGKQVSDWGDFVYAKVNAPTLLKKDIRKLKNNGAGLSVLLSSVTDPYQGIEVKYKLTRRCLKVFLDGDFKGRVSVLTKSPLAVRDIDILQKIQNVEVGFTITSTNDEISRYFEKMAPNATQRLKALKVITDVGIKTYAFVGPLLPHYITEEETLDELFASIAKTGVKEVYVEHINLSNYILGRLKSEMKGMDRSIWKEFYESKEKSYRTELDRIVMRLIKKHGLKLRMGETIYHRKK